MYGGRKMKKIAYFILITVLLCSQFIIYPSALANNTTMIKVSETIEYLPDGTKIVTIIEEEVPSVSTRATTYTKTGSKTSRCINDNEQTIWTFTTKGTFSVVEGTSSTCTSASYSYTTPGSNWSLKSGSATKSSNKAIGNGIFVQKILGITLKTNEATCTLTCSKTGVLS